MEKKTQLIINPKNHVLHLAKQLSVQEISANSSYVEEIHKRAKLGGSSYISLVSLKKFQIETDVVVILDCEGNY